MIKLFKKFTTIYINPVVILLIVNLANIANFFFQVIASRNLTYFEFSLFFTTISIINILLGPFASIQLFIQQNLIKIKNKIKSILFIKFTLKVFFIFQIIFLFIFLIFLEKIKQNFGYHETLYYTYFFFYFILSMTMIIPGGILYSERKYKTTHFIILLIDIIRVLFLFLFISYFKDKLLFMIILNILYSILCILIMFKKSGFNFKISILNIFFVNYFTSYLKKKIRIFFKFFFYSACLPIITQADIIFVKFLFSDHVSSSYIVTSTIAKTIYIIPAVLHSYVFNEFYFKNKFRIILNYFFIFILSFAVLIILLFVIKPFIIYFYGTGYLITLSAFKYIVLSFLLISFTNFVINFFLVKKDFNFLYIFYITIIFYCVLNFFNNSSYIDISLNLLVSAFIMFLSLCFYYYYKYISFEFSKLLNFFR